VKANQFHGLNVKILGTNPLLPFRKCRKSWTRYSSSFFFLLVILWFIDISYYRR